MTQAWAKLARLTGRASGCTRNSATPAAMNGTTWATVMAVHIRLARSRRPASARGRQWTAASSGSGSAATGLGYPPEIGRRMITRSAPTGSSRTCSAWPSPVETMAK